MVTRTWRAAGLAVLVSMLMGLSALPAAWAANEAEEVKEKHKLVNCQDEEFGVEFLCNPEWGLHAGDGAVLLVISTSPAVTLTIVKAESPYRFLSQITKPILAEKGHYAEGFRKEEVRFAGQEAVMVKAFAKAYPEIRFLEYYLIRESAMYNVLFSVNPKENWDDYKFLVKTMVDSFKFLQ